MKSPTKFRAGVIGAALTFFLVLQLLPKYPNFVEQYYSNGLYPILNLITSNFASQFPFSLSELSLWCMILFGIPIIINRIRKKKMNISRILLNLAMTISFVYVWFYLFWGINYFRAPLKAKLQLENVQLPIDAFDSTFVDIVNQANNLNVSYSIQEVAQINTIVQTSYEKVLAELGIKSAPIPGRLKTFTVNWLLNKTTTSGWFSPFFHEVHYNRDLLIFELPFVIAHEQAHLLGFTNEAEANFLAYLVCTNSSDPLVKYSGYFNLLGHFLYYLKENQEKREFFTDLINQRVKLDLAAVRQRWKSHRGFVSDMSDKSYDLYLKANHVNEGVQNYSRVVDLIVRYYKQQNLIPG